MIDGATNDPLYRPDWLYNFPSHQWEAAAAAAAPLRFRLDRRGNFTVESKNDDIYPELNCSCKSSISFMNNARTSCILAMWIRTCLSIVCSPSIIMNGILYYMEYGIWNWMPSICGCGAQKCQCIICVRNVRKLSISPNQFDIVFYKQNRSTSTPEIHVRHYHCIAYSLCVWNIGVT